MLHVFQSKKWMDFIYIFMYIFMYICIHIFMFISTTNNTRYWRYGIMNMGNAAEDTTTLVTLVYPCCWALKAPRRVEAMTGCHFMFSPKKKLGPFKQIPMDDERDVFFVASIPSSQHIYQHSLEDATNWPLSKHLKQIQVLCGFSKILFGEFQAARMKKLQRKNNGWNQIPIVATSILCRRLLLIATKSFN